ncbi:hypothetical protein HC02_08300 [Vibrio parahaemolyticus]|nr:hypothetical protein HC02_08300 [Vibrio parahaemolyticus]
MQASKVIKNCTEEFDVHQLFNRWVCDLFKDNQFIYCKNKHTNAINQSNAIELPPMAHGLNSYSHLNEVAFMAHLRPAPEHEAAIKRLAKDINISHNCWWIHILNKQTMTLHISSLVASHFVT